METIDIIKLAKSIIKKYSPVIRDRAIEYNDLLQEMIIKGFVEQTKTQTKSSSFIYSVMRNHMLNILIRHSYRAHERIDEKLFFLPAKDFYTNGNWDSLTKQEQVIVQDALNLFEFGADTREIKKRFKWQYPKEYKQLRDKIRSW